MLFCNRSCLLRIVLLWALTAILLATGLLAQSTGPRVGIAASLATRQTDVMIPLRWSKFMLAPSLSFANVGDVSTDLGLGLTYRQYFKVEKTSPYFTLRGGLLSFGWSGKDKVTDIVLGAGIGGEYSFDDHFSISVEAQANVSFSDKLSGRFGNPGGTNINTASAVMAIYYF